MRAALVLACAACRGEPQKPPAPPAPKLVVLDAHAGATALYGDERLVMSFVQDWDKPGPLRLSRGRGPVERTLQGWPIGVAGERAYLAEPDGAQLRIVRVGLAGEPEELLRVAAPRSPYRIVGSVTGDGHVALAVPGEDSTRFVVVAPDKTTRDIAAVRPTDAVVALVGDPRGPDLAVVSSWMRGYLDAGAPSAAIIEFDAATGTVRWSIPFDRSFAADEGETAFVDAGLAVHLGDQLVAFERMHGVRTTLLDGATFDARSVAIAPAGDAVAYVHRVHNSDMMPLPVDPACEVFIARRGQPPPAEPVKRYAGGCYFGMGITYVGSELWIAPLGH
jgi:hypothetical protein